MSSSTFLRLRPDRTWGGRILGACAHCLDQWIDHTSRIGRAPANSASVVASKSEVVMQDGQQDLRNGDIVMELA